MIDAAQQDGCTGLWLAAENGHLSVVKLLISYGASLNPVKDPGNVTPLYIAAQNGHSRVVQELIAAGASPNVAKTSGATPLYIAAQQDFTDIVLLLLEAGANPNLATNEGISPIMVAAFRGNLDTVQLLVEHGADVAVRGGGRDVMEWAQSNGHGAAVRRILDDVGAKKRQENERRVGLASGGAGAGGVSPAAASSHLPASGSRRLTMVTDTPQHALDLSSLSSPPSNRQQQQQPQQKHSNQQRGLAQYDDATTTIGGGYDDHTSWYTPRYLTGVHGEKSSNRSATFGGPNLMHQNLQGGGGGGATTPRSVRQRLGVTATSSPLVPSHDQYRDASQLKRALDPQSHHLRRNTMNSSVGASGFACGGALSHQRIEEEAQRNTLFRQQIARSVKAPPLSLDNASGSGGGGGAPNKAALLAIEQQWEKFQRSLRSEAAQLEESAAEVHNSWMLSVSALTQYTEGPLREMRKKQHEAQTKNSEAATQRALLGGTALPPLPADRLAEMTKFVAAGADAKGPPEVVPVAEDDEPFSPLKKPA